MLTLKPVRPDNASSHGFTCNMICNGDVLFRKISLRILGVLNHTKVVSKDVRGVCSIARDVAAQASKRVSEANSLLCS